jgi:hypothetical protein
VASKRSLRKTKSSRDFLDLAEKVQMWAVTNNLGDSAQIQDLMEDLRERRNWHYWSSVRAGEIIPEIKSSKLAAIRARYRQVLFLRNLMVFLPVTFTWIAISEASSAFSEFTTVNQSSVVNFLQFWQDGFGFLSPIWRLSTVALIDFFILAFIMVLTVLLHGLSSRTEVLRQQEISFNAGERESLARELYDFFQRNQTISTLTIDRTLVRAIRDLDKATQNLERLTRDLGKSVKEFPTYLTVIREVKNFSSRLNKIERKTNGPNSPD